MKITMKKAQNYLFILWSASGIVIFLLIIIGIIFGKYDENENVVVGWFLTTIMPILSLIIAVIYTKGQKEKELNQASESTLPPKLVDNSLFLGTFILSCVYLLIALGILLLSPLLFHLQLKTPIEIIKSSHVYLGVLQTVTTATLGYFFVKEE